MALIQSCASQPQQAPMQTLRSSIRAALIPALGATAALRSLALASVFLAFSNPLAAKTPAQDIAGEHAPEPQLTLDDLRTFSEVFASIRQYYVEDVDDHDLMEAALSGMLSKLDPHSEWISAEEYGGVEEHATGRYGGLGIEFQIVEGHYTVVTAVDDTPAAKAGIKPGQIILAVDGKKLQDNAVQNAVEAMRGEPGTEVVLDIFDPEQDKRADVTLTREVIHAVSVRGRLVEPGLAYLRIASFQEETATQLERNIDKLRESNGGTLDGLIIDVRNNPGGVLFSAVQSADLFLDAGKIVSTRGRKAETYMEFNADRRLLVPKSLPIIILVNGGSASAAEILAAALQDHHRAIILGQRTFGKGSVQSVVPMRNGGAIRLTTSRYYTPNDRSIQLEGVIPDIQLPAQVSVSMNTRTSTREADLERRLDAETADSDGSDTPVESESTSLVEEDFALFEAVNLLKSLKIAARH